MFGGFATTNWQVKPLFYGDGECFVFSVLPLPAVYKATHSNECYMISNSTMIGMGGEYVQTQPPTPNLSSVHPGSFHGFPVNTQIHVFFCFW